MSWLPWILPYLLLALAVAMLVRRRAELRAHSANLAERTVARQRGSDQARLQHPSIDLQQCIGCGSCVQACPEDGVLALSYGQAVVVHGARCVGHGLCAEACPTGAIALTLGDLAGRRDLPAIDEHLEATTVPGLFLAGEITGFALVRTAVQHGVMVARTVAARRRAASAVPVLVHNGGGGIADQDRIPDLLIVGAGPAGFACALAARELGLDFRCLEQGQQVGGTVAGYPRRKLVMTQPMELPLCGRLSRLSYSKEELVELWQRLAREHELPIETGTEVTAVQRQGDGTFALTTAAGAVHFAHHVVLALGRRGSPRRLGVPGEDDTKVSYGLLDAHGYAGRRVLVVGGGDSAVEAALALSAQPGTQVHLSYRKPDFFRLKARNEQAVREAMAAGRLGVLFRSEVVRIEPDRVVLAQDGTAGRRELELPNDDVFVLAGGNPPFPLLEAAGVSFDPAQRPPPPEVVDPGQRALLLALASVLLAVTALLGLGIWRADYYGLPLPQRPDSPWHDWLRPQGPIGLGAGVLAVAMFIANLTYLLRRSRFGGFLGGNLRAWMGAHVFTGLLALPLVVLHCGFRLRDSVGGHAFVALLTVVAAGAVGRWLYAFVPRLQNGKQAELEDVGNRVAALAGEWDVGGAGLAATVRRQVEELVAAEQWRRSLPARLWGLVRSQWRLWRQLAAFRRQAAAQGMPAPEVARLLALARTAHRLSLQLTHFEEVRGLLSSWRWFHRWLALLLVLLTVLHVLTALRYGGVDWNVLLPRSGGAR